MTDARLFLGIDASTQSMSVLAVDYFSGKSVFSKSVNFDESFPSYKTSSGCVSNPNNSREIYSFPQMWLDALDLAMSELAKNVDTSQIAGISISGQQHASVWLKSSKVFNNFDANKTLSENMANAYSTERAPIWMDTSTSQECAEIAEHVGGDEEVLRRTGSVMTERFTGSQIRKKYKKEGMVYADTGRIHLNSSFICSILAGKDAPIDYCDASGMNLMNIQTLTWDDVMLCATSPDLAQKLPALCNPDSIVGNISTYFVEKYGFSKDAKIVPATGDNPSSLVGVGAILSGGSAVSLGTSDTFFASMENPNPVAGSHIMSNPAGGYMALACFKNGSLARETLKKDLDVDWAFFDRGAFENKDPKVDSPIILPFVSDEISPKLKSNGIVYIGGSSEKMSKAQKVCAFVEGQAMNIYARACRLSNGEIKYVVLTGGASKSDGIAQTISDVFGVTVYRLDSVTNSAALGAAMRAAKSVSGSSWKDICQKFCKMTAFKKPNLNNTSVYRHLTKRFLEAMSETFGA